jgi:hypothetical protein
MDIYHQLLVENGMAVAAGVIVLIAVIVLVAWRKIGFMTSLLLMLLALGALLLIKHWEAVASFWSPAVQKIETPQQPETEAPKSDNRAPTPPAPVERRQNSKSSTSTRPATSAERQKSRIKEFIEQ